jgi:two-component system cell cycle response regulator DivK
MCKKIIIFDDDKDILEVTSVILRKRDYRVKTVRDLDNFMEMILEYKPDVILMDLRIPEIGGKEATRLLKNKSPTRNIPVILFTAHNNGKENLIEVTGADDVLFKPFNITNLVNKIEAVI